MNNNIEDIVLDEETIQLINSTVPELERVEAIRLAKVALLAERKAQSKSTAKIHEDVLKPVSSIKPAAAVVYLTKAQREALRAEAAIAPSLPPQVVVSKPIATQPLSNPPSDPSTLGSLSQSIELAEIEASKERYLGKSYRVEMDARKAEETILAKSMAPPASRGGARGGHRQVQRGGASFSSHHGGGQLPHRSSHELPAQEGASVVSLLRQKATETGNRRRERFKFRWDNTDDTSTDFNSLYTYNTTAAAPESNHNRGMDDSEPPPSKRPALQGQGALGGGSSALLEIEDDELDQRDRRKEELEEVAAARRAEERGGEFLTAEEEHGPSHWSKKKLADMTERDWRIFREDFDIHMRGNFNTAGGARENARVIINPLRSWNECPMHHNLREAINEMGYKNPSPIQRAALPMGMAGRDMIGIAETGSGKTAAFLIPLLHHVLMQPLEARARCAENGPLALVMAPTRELAQQIDEECKKLSRFCGIKSLAVVGGTNMAEQGVKMREGCEVIIGTPGRLIDCISTSILVLNQCNYVVLDEADRMIDLGFEPQVSQILESMGLQGVSDDMADSSENVGRTTHMFTATMPSSVERLAKRFMKTPATLRIGDQDSGKNKRILQEIIFVPNEKRKRVKLLELLSSVQKPCIIFINAKKACNVIAREVEHAGYNCVVLHSDKSQDEREGALRDFKSGNVDLLIATDVAGRGLDINGVETVINYDMPSDISRYTHRIGRTGRAGKGGRATTLLTDDDSQIFSDLKAYLESTSQMVPSELSSRVSTLERSKGDRRMM